MKEEKQVFWQMLDGLVQTYGKDAQEAIRMAGIRSTLTGLFTEDATTILALLENEGVAFWDAAKNLAMVGFDAAFIVRFIEKAKMFDAEQKDFVAEIGAAMIVKERQRALRDAFSGFDVGGIVSPKIGGDDIEEGEFIINPKQAKK